MSRKSRGQLRQDIKDLKRQNKRLAQRNQELEAQASELQLEVAELQAEVAEERLQLQEARDDLEELEFFLESADPPSRPTTSDDTRNQRLEYLNNVMLAEDITDFSALTQEHAMRILDKTATLPDDEVDSDAKQLGCRLAALAPGHRYGYLKKNLRKTHGLDGILIGMNLWLHQVAAVAAGMGELLGKCKRRGKNSYQVSHLCHRTNCFEPSHLIIETSSDNMQRNNCARHFEIMVGSTTIHPCPHGATLASRLKCILPARRLAVGSYYTRGVDFKHTY